LNSVNELTVGLHSWIIQDGNYGDFAVGDQSKFALEFFGNALRASASLHPTMEHVDKDRYRVVAQVMFADPKVWVIDFGLQAFWESPPPAFAQPGAWVEGEIVLGVDPFFYSEYLCKIPEMPNLLYNWRVTAISRNDTPWLVQVNERGGKTFSRDVAREKWSNFHRTDAWNDDEGRSSYVLTVARRDV